MENLNDDILAEAFHILFDNEWKKNWSNRDKAREMRDIIRGNDQPCRPFKNWIACINFLNNK